MTKKEREQLYKKEYTKTRENLMRKIKYHTDRGYHIKPDKIEKFNIPSYTKLSEKPTAKDIKVLKNLSQKEFYTSLEKDFYDDLGKSKTFNLREGLKIERKISAQKGVLTKRRKKNEFHGSIIKTEDGYIVTDEWGEVIEPEVDENGEITNNFPDLADLPFSEDEFPTDYEVPMSDEYADANYENYNGTDTGIINEVDEVLYNVETNIMKLYGFKSIAKNRSTAKHNESAVYDLTDKIYKSFIDAANADRQKLALNCILNATEINGLLEKVKSAYLHPDTSDGIAMDLFDIFNGSATIEDAKMFDSGYDEGGAYIYD